MVILAAHDNSNILFFNAWVSVVNEGTIKGLILWTVKDIVGLKGLSVKTVFLRKIRISYNPQEYFYFL